MFRWEADQSFEVSGVAVGKAGNVCKGKCMNVCVMAHLKYTGK